LKRITISILNADGKTAVTCVAWNQSVQHILASTSANGSSAIWNLKQRKASIVYVNEAGFRVYIV
jgi:protein transport protein SEC31